MISFVIPAYNEESVISTTLATLKRFGPNETFEIILVDNGSTDSTAKLAAEHGAIVVQYAGGTIAAARNYGVQHSQGDILIFIDADVLLTAEWQAHIAKQIDTLRQEPLQITGARCLPPNDNSWFNLYWYGLMSNDNASYINSGHLITTRILFDAIQGFTAALKTAEDHDFCQKAKNRGAAINPNPRLQAIHDGYPKSLKQFIQRERWHGREDFKSISSYLESKIAWLATLNLLGFVFGIMASLYLQSPVPLMLYVSIMLAGCACLGVLKFKFDSPKHFINNTIIHYLYFCGRSMALLDRLTGNYARRFRE